MRDAARPRHEPLVVHCGDGVSQGPEGTFILNQAGFAGAVNPRAGIRGWAAARPPVEPGAGRQA